MHTIFMGNLRWRQQLYARMWGARAAAGWWRAGLAPLCLVAHGYGGLAWAHRTAYTWGIRQQRHLPCPVVSIGNLTLGGTGKTPLTMWIARWYQQQGRRVAVLSRGYGARPAAHVRVVSAGDGPVLNWQAAGDEPYLLACALPGVPILIGQDRYQTGQYACTHFGAEVLILDDGFQHHALHRDLDIVLIDASNPFGSGHLFPRGILREPLSALRRADALVLTRVEMAEETVPALCQRLQRWYGQTPIYAMRTDRYGAASHHGCGRCRHHPPSAARRRICGDWQSPGLCQHPSGSGHRGGCTARVSRSPSLYARRLAGHCEHHQYPACHRAHHHGKRRRPVTLRLAGASAPVYAAYWRDVSHRRAALGQPISSAYAPC
ncbi:MAG: tetraacyldisaccharide 4'-kinase [Candidatus Tectomicrobia bacterium]|uniref:Tetraacyldisaccharide 4'-kinase n=1 Tax=Tectimicrobiota bacterium TaxID=2528274 RepID=A0A937W3E7_UNCTE|nr:tetraacyldisaccharide 4'-kinase [Candidatus Tectomicrobia bacterium]